MRFFVSGASPLYKGQPKGIKKERKNLTAKSSCEYLQLTNSDYFENLYMAALHFKNKKISAKDKSPHVQTFFGT